MALVDLLLRGSRALSSIQNASLENPSTSIEAWADEVGLTRKVDAGVKVTNETAIGLPAMWRGVNVVCNDVAKLHCGVFRAVGEDDFVPEISHPSDTLISRVPCPSLDLTAGLWRKMLQYRALMIGNGYAWIDRDPRTYAPRELLPLSGFVSPIIEISFESRRLWYVVTIGNEMRKVPSENILHIRGLAFDGLVGHNVVDVMCQALGLAIAGQTFASKYFSAGGKAGGYLVAPGNLTEKQIENIRETWHQMKPGIDAAHRPGVLYGGLDWKQVTIDPDKAQALETRTMSRRDVANILNVEPYKLGEETGDSYGSLEIRSQDHLDSSIDPWLRTHEEEYEHKLLTEEEKDARSHVIRFDRKGLMRVDFQVRAEAHRKYREVGVLSVDDLRGELDMPKVGSKNGGDLRHVPRNWTVLGHELDAPAKASGSQNGQKQAENDQKSRQKEAKRAAALHDLIVHSAVRLSKAETSRLIDAARDPRTMLARSEEVLAQFGEKWRDALAPILRVCDREDAAAEASRLTAEHSAKIKAELLKVSECAPADLLSRVETWVDQVMRDEPVRLAALVAVAS